MGLEDPINLYANTVMKKQEIRNDLNKEFAKTREDIEKNVYIKYPARSSEVLFLYKQTINFFKGDHKRRLFIYKNRE